MTDDLVAVWEALRAGGFLAWVSLGLVILVIVSGVRAKQLVPPLIGLTLAEGWLASYWLAVTTGQSVLRNDSPVKLELRIYYLSLESRAPLSIAVLGCFCALGILGVREALALRSAGEAPHE